MYGFRGVALAVLGGLIGTVAVATSVVGCGGDDNNPGDSGADQTAEGGPDVATDVARDTSGDAKDGGLDVTTDVPVADTGREADVTVDVAVDTGRDGGDAAVDVADARDSAPESSLGDADAAILGDADAEAGPNAIQQYATAYGQAYCAGQGKCCPGYPAAFDQASCAPAWQISGWEYTLPPIADVYTAGHLNFDATKGAACLAALQAFTCPDDAGTVPASQYSALTNACLGVLTGTIANGSGGCLSSFECSNGYCNRTADGGAGTGVCTALVGSAGTCSPGGDSPDQMCSRAGAYQPMLWCNRLDGGATGTCAAPLADNATCYDPTVSATYFDDYGCTSLLCGDLGCGGTVTYAQLGGFCANWPTDGGTD
jgi:hypothetical protein